MRVARARATAGLSGPLGLSLLLHLSLVATLLVFRGTGPVARPPMYRVDLVAAPAGTRQEGIVPPRPQPPTPAPETPTPPPRAQTNPRDMPMPAKATPPTRQPPAPATPVEPRATTTPSTTPAGGGPTGGRGTDVVTVRTEGVEFPFPRYLENIVRQIAKNFTPPRNTTLSAEVMFLIRRDGSIADLRIAKRSGNYAFDLEALGAVEAAGNARAFGPLPDGFTDDVLPVIFSFDPTVLR
ncbi:MAG TPA: TonB C-terminal domain-containing protein [Gemmatimonadaceae bacterium]|nr:TonB C-terminal domain-containing protein [Gemmatimonadaceae bacterium]